MTPKSSRGFSLAELLMALTLLSMIVLFSFLYLDRSQRLWRRVNASSSAGQSLRKASARLGPDLRNCGKKEIDTTTNGTGTQRLGDAVWFLSAEHPDDGTFVRTDGGGSFWQRNILYYLTVPLDHDSRYGTACHAWERVCPHKILLRKVIDSGPATTPASPESAKEELLTVAQAAAYLTRPATLDLSTASEPGVTKVEYVTGTLLDLRVELEKSGESVLEVRCDLEAPLLEDARGHVAVGQQPFPANTFTLVRRLAAIPAN